MVGDRTATDHEVMHTSTAATVPLRRDAEPRPARDPAMDLLRAVALAIVVLGHWLIAVVHWHHGSLVAHNLLDVAPATQWLTWLFQPMPLFFAVGGWAAARSWGHREPATTPTSWLASRLDRLLGPVITYVVSVVILTGLLVAVIGPDADDAGRLLGMHLWFLAVYVPVTAATPWLLRQVTSHGWKVPLAFATAVVATDTVRFLGDVPAVGWANFAFLWLGFAAFGIASALRPPRTGSLLTVAAVTGLALVIVVGAGWYPHSMVGVGDRSNNTPPTVALGLLGITQVALVWAGIPRLRARLHSRRNVRNAIGVAGAVSIHVYLWHLCAVIVAIGIMRTGFANFDPLTHSWWASRPLWWLALALLTGPIVAVAISCDRRRPARTVRADSCVRVGIATTLATGALTAIALGGVAPDAVSIGSLVALCGAARMTQHRAAPARHPGRARPDDVVRAGVAEGLR